MRDEFLTEMRGNKRSISEILFRLLSTQTHAFPVKSINPDLTL